MYTYDTGMSSDGCSLHLGPPVPSITTRRDLGAGLGLFRTLVCQKAAGDAQKVALSPGHCQPSLQGGKRQKVLLGQSLA